MVGNETEAWSQNNASTRYNLPETCPFCQSPLKATYTYVGIYPYIHADFTLECHLNPHLHKFNFCFPFNKAQTMGYTVYDSHDQPKPKIERICPFHHEHLEVVRYYGDAVFKDGTRKLQLRCPICFYSERYIL
jgi:hypothetical protein